jgi:nitrate reductase alpha subunit
MPMDRRDFLRIGVGGACAATVDWRYFHPVLDASEARLADRYVRSTCSPNCTGACGFLARVTDGRIATLIQAADYPEEEYNPRGCLKGMSMMNLVYGKDRLKYPLIRTGARGTGEFRRAGWDEALDLAAEKLGGIAERYGPEAVAMTVQVPGTGYVQKGAFVAMAGLNEWSIHHGYDQNGDLPMFWPMTFGVQSEELEALEWRNARYTLVFGSNIIQTRLPDAQHLLEAKRRGKLVVVDPDYSPTAAKADEWIGIAPDTDAALALGMARVILDRGLHDADFLRDFTDLPILVREDTGKRLRAGDVAGLAPEARQRRIPDYRSLYVVHASGGLRILDPETLRPTGADLDAELRVRLTDGTTVGVTTVFQKLREGLDAYPLERVAAITGAPRQQIERIAVEVARGGPLHVVYGASDYQWYHGDLKGRAISLIPVLTGNLGKSGAGLSTLAGQYRIRFPLGAWWSPEGSRLNWVPYLYFLQGKGPGYPRHGIRAMVGGWGNPFDQHNMANVLKDRAASGELEFILTTDFQMTTSAEWSDVVLPVPTWYEKVDLTATILHPYLQLQQPAIEPLFESRSELWIARELTRRLAPGAESHFFPELDEQQAAWRAMELLLETGGSETRGITVDMLRSGPVRLHSPAPDDRQIPFWEQIQERRPFPPRSYPAPLAATARFVRSGRIEFYKDEDAFLEAGETLPVQKATFEETEYAADATARTRFPLRFVTRNSLYRVHSTHSNNPWMMELQDSRPKVFLSAGDAERRRIRDGDEVEVHNDRGRVRGYAVVDPRSRDGTCTFEQGWWSRYLDGESYNSLTYPWIKPLHEVYFVPGMWSPTTCWNECLVDVRRVTA